MKPMKIIIALLLSFSVCTAVAAADTSIATGSGILRVDGRPSDGQPNNIILFKCQADSSGALLRSSCAPFWDPSVPDCTLNQDIRLSPGFYEVSYDSGASAFVRVEAGKRVSVHLEKILFPKGVAASNVRVFQDLTNPREQAAFLMELYGSNLVDQINYEGGCEPPLLASNTVACNAVNNAQRASDLLNTYVKINSFGEPLYWNFYHHEFVGDTSAPCIALNCVAAGPSANFVALLPGVYGIAVFNNATIASITRGIHSTPAITQENSR